MRSVVMIIIRSFLMLSLIFIGYSLFSTTIDEIDLMRNVLYPSLLLTTVLTIVHLIFSMRVGVRQNFSSTQTHTISSSVQLQELVSNIERNLSWKLIRKDTNVFVFKSNFSSLKSFGEIITVKQKQGMISVCSKPAFFTTIFDFGKNYENIKRIKSLI